MEVALFPLRNSSIRIFSCTNDYLVCSHSQKQVTTDSIMVLNHVRNLGFRINEVKSRLEPSQCMEYLGLSIKHPFLLCNTVKATGVDTQTLSRAVSAREWEMVSVISVVCLGLFMMKDFQQWMAGTTASWFAAPFAPQSSVLTSAVPLGVVLCRMTVTTDASPWGRGADADGRDSQWCLVTTDGTLQKHTRNAAVF